MHLGHSLFQVDDGTQEVHDLCSSPAVLVPTTSGSLGDVRRLGVYYRVWGPDVGSSTGVPPRLFKPL